MNKDFAILLDSTCNLTLNDLKEYNLDYCLMTVSIDDKIYPADLTWPDISEKEFYDIMRSGKRVFTQLITEDEYRRKFNQYLDENKDILYIACSSGLSGSVKVAKKIGDEILAKRNDGSKIIIIDSLISGLGQGMMGFHASDLRKEGKSIDEVAGIIENEKLNYNMFATVGSLTYLKNAGRVSASSAFFGNIIGIKPIIISDVNGHNCAYKKVRGRKAALEEIASSIASYCVEPEKHFLCIDNANCADEAKDIIHLVEEKGIKFKRYYTNPLGPILGASCGPETIVSFFYGVKKMAISGNK